MSVIDKRNRVLNGKPPYQNNLGAFTSFPNHGKVYSWFGKGARRFWV